MTAARDHLNASTDYLEHPIDCYLAMAHALISIASTLADMADQEQESNDYQACTKKLLKEEPGRSKQCQSLV